MIALVIIDKKIKALDQMYAYIIPRYLSAQIGHRVIVPFGKQRLEGFVVDIVKEIKNNKYELKNILSVKNESPVLNKEMIILGEEIAKKTLATKSSVYQAMVPKALNIGNKKDVNIKKIVYIELVNDNVSSTAKKQLEVLLYLKNNGKTLKSSLNKISSFAVKELIKNKNVKEIYEEEYRLKNKEYEYKRVTLNDEQNNAVNEIVENKGKIFLLKGVTGSGKTEVYMEVIEKEIKDGKEAIVLVPEISLTSQLAQRFKARFKDNVAVLHSALSDGEKYDEWRKITRGEVKIVIGARSAIFAPFTNLGVIIVDEENSQTYKQDNNPRYHAIDVAKLRSKYHKCSLVLGSATPTLEDYARAKKGIYKLLEIKKRINNEPPTINVVNMTDEMKKGKRYFSQILLDKIKDRIEKKEQIILLINRRGYATFSMCHLCGYVHKCPRCDISLTYHKKSNTMRCHYCGYGEKKLMECPDCHEKSMTNYGMGTQRIQEELNKLFPLCKVVRMDADTTSKKGSHEKIINDFKDLKYDILLGTQMIAKGLDFPKVTLVGVINGDTSLNIPDFRSSERTFELLTQVAGRAGRKDLKGEVIIQTFNPDHYSILNIGNYESFYNHEMVIRKKLKYSPYYNLILIRILSKDYDMGTDASSKVARFLNKEKKEDVYILGPSESSISKIKDVYRFQCLIKYRKDENIFELLKRIDDFYKKDVKINIEIDINPIRI